MAALSDSATVWATPSELTRKVRPSPSKPSGGMTGITSPIEQLGKEGVVDPLDPAGEFPVHAADDAEGMGDHRVRVDGPQVARRKALHDFMGNSICGGERHAEGARVGHAGAVEVGEEEARLVGQLPHLVADAVDDHDPDAQAAEDGEVEQDIGEIVAGDDRAVDRDDENLIPELGDVGEDAAQVGDIHESGWLRKRRHEGFKKLTK